MDDRHGAAPVCCASSDGACIASQAGRVSAPAPRPYDGKGVEGESHAALFWSCSRIALCRRSPTRSVSAPSSAARRRAIRSLIARWSLAGVVRWAANFSRRWPDQNDPNLLPGNRLGRLIHRLIDEDCDDRISARHRMIGEKNDRLPGGRNLDRAANHAFARQFLSLSRDVMLQRLTYEAHPDTVAAARGCPLRRHQRILVGEPVVTGTAQRPQYESLAGQRTVVLTTHDPDRVARLQTARLALA